MIYLAEVFVSGDSPRTANFYEGDSFKISVDDAAGAHMGRA